MSSGSNAGQLDLSFEAMVAPRRVWTPRELVSATRTTVEREYGDVWVQGEISNYRPADSGHLYFTLKDDAAQLRVVMFRTQARLLRFKPENGLHVIARGRITIYEARGELQLSAEYLEPQGAGALQIAFEQLKAKLYSEGLFDQSGKRPLPAFPQRVGVITSPRGAAVRDIINIIQRRHAGIGLLIYPAQVQGEIAAAECAAGIKFFNRARSVEVIILARGGGSLEDLAAFNDEALARVIADSKIPVVSAIGHETDFTIADFVADLRAPTPSAAAELVVQSRAAIEESIANFRQRLGRAVRYQLMRAQRLLTEFAQHGAFARIRDVITRREQRLDDLRYRLATGWESVTRRRRHRLSLLDARLRSFELRRAFAAWRRDLEAQKQALIAAARQTLLKQRAQWQRADARLRELSPAKILERGYALVFDAPGNLVKDAAAVREGDSITAQLARGRIAAVVKKS
jgi:exodeoxyribonuclease VII large subunit